MERSEVLHILKGIEPQRSEDDRGPVRQESCKVANEFVADGFRLTLVQ